jgi:hypothetical protein
MTPMQQDSPRRQEPERTLPTKTDDLYQQPPFWISYNEHISVESGITVKNGRKIGLLIPLWEVKSFFIEGSKGNGKCGKPGVLGYRFETQKSSKPGILAAS